MIDMIDINILRYFEGKKCVVTGGTGLIGRQVVKLLCDSGAQVTIVSLDKVTVDSRADHVFGDLTDLTFCIDLFRGYDVVFHLAGVKGSMNVSKTMLASHFVPTMMLNTNVLEAAKRSDVEKLVYTSSIGAYPNADVFKEDEKYDNPPMDFAGWAKRMGELQIQAYHTQFNMSNFAIVRPSNVYGPGDNFDPENAMVVPSLMCRIRQGERPLKVWGDGSAVRDFVYSRDCAEGILLACYYGTDAGFVNLGSGGGTSVKELVDALADVTGCEYEFDTSKPSGAPLKVMDISLARERINYRPTTSLREGLEETWKWFLENEDEYKFKQNYFIN